jgi:hypothetical protein
MSMKEDDKSAAAVAVAPRVSLADIEAAIRERCEFTAGQACQALGISATNALGVMSICILVMKNGYTVVGTSAPASLANFDPGLGKKFAYDSAVRQLWPLMGFCLRDRLAAEEAEAAARG